MNELELTVEALKRCVPAEVFEKAMAQVKTAAPQQGAKPAMTLEQTIEQLLLNAGMPTSIKGFRMSVTAIRLIVEKPEIAEGITKWLYPEIAKIHGSTYVRVERAIRYAVEVTWTRCDPDVLYGYFRNTIDPRRCKPTNSEFLTRMAYLVRDQRMS